MLSFVLGVARNWRQSRAVIFETAQAGTKNKVVLTRQNKNKLVHDSTLISKHVRTIEKDVVRKLDKIVNEIRTDNLSNHNDVLLKHIYGTAVYDVIRSAVQRSYSEGIDHVAVDAHKIEGFLSSSDLLVIKGLATRFASQFWFLVDKYFVKAESKRKVLAQPLMQRRQQVSTTRYTFVSTSPLSMNSRITVLATTITHMTLAVATIEKARQLQNKQKTLLTGKAITPTNLKVQKDVSKVPAPTQRRQLPPPQNVTGPVPPVLDDTGQEPIIATTPQDVEETGWGLTGIGSLLTLLGLQQQQQASDVSNQVVWMTAQDDRVCPICAALEGQTWDVNDPDIPVPGGEGDTHFNCRCRLMILGSDNEVVAAGEGAGL